MIRNLPLMKKYMTLGAIVAASISLAVPAYKKLVEYEIRNTKTDIVRYSAIITKEEGSDSVAGRIMYPGTATGILLDVALSHPPMTHIISGDLDFMGRTRDYPCFPEGKVTLTLIKETGPWSSMNFYTLQKVVDARGNSYCESVLPLFVGSGTQF